MHVAGEGYKMGLIFTIRCFCNSLQTKFFCFDSKRKRLVARCKFFSFSQIHIFIPFFLNMHVWVFLIVTWNFTYVMSLKMRTRVLIHAPFHSTGKYDFSCPTCGKGFQCKSYLRVHQRTHSNVKPYPCITCGQNFKSKQSLINHTNRHLGVKPYMCDICGRGFVTRGD